MAIKKLDVVTQVCPFPLIEAKAALAEMASGDELVIEFDCTQATEAIPQWAAEEGHAITDYQQVGDAARASPSRKRDNRPLRRGAEGDSQTISSAYCHSAFSSTCFSLSSAYS